MRVGRVDWAMTLNNLGTALQALGDRESNTARLEEAVTAYDAALAVFIEAGAGHYIKGCQANKSRVAMLLHKEQHQL
jgi:Tetratricopeptide repeat